jgi:carboxymethylenebutenolidase
MSAYRASPKSGENRPAVVVAFEMFGLTPYVREVTDRVASLGYTAIAPDFYHREGPGNILEESERSRGFELIATLTRDGVLADVRAALAFAGNPAKAGMLGLSLGGHLAYLAAARLPLAATAVFYGGWLTTTELALGKPEPTVTLTPDIRGKLLFLTGSADHAVPAADVERIGAALAEGGHELVVYPDTPHGFFCHRRDTYRPETANDAWRRVRKLFAEELG